VKGRMKRGRTKVRRKSCRRKTNKRRRLLRGGSTTTPTFHVLIATGGRASLKEMTDSLKSQLRAGDALTIIFDGEKAKKRSTYDDSWLADCACATRIIEQVPGLGHYGHPVLNKYIPELTPKTTFIMFADDDDTYLPGAFDALRSKCSDPKTLYISRMKHKADPSKVIPDAGLTEIHENHIGKPNGIIPFDSAPLSKLENNYVGDFHYYKNLSETGIPVVFLDDIIYEIGANQGNVK